MLHGGGGGGAGKRAGTVAFAVPDTPLESEPRSASQVVSDVLLYQNPSLTYVTAAAGVLVLAAAWFALRGAHGLTLLTGGWAGGRHCAPLAAVLAPPVCICAFPMTFQGSAGLAFRSLHSSAPRPITLGQDSCSPAVA